MVGVARWNLEEMIVDVQPLHKMLGRLLSQDQPHAGAVHLFFAGRARVVDLERQDGACGQLASIPRGPPIRITSWQVRCQNTGFARMGEAGKITSCRMAASI